MTPRSILIQAVLPAALLVAPHVPSTAPLLAQSAATASAAVPSATQPELAALGIDDFERWRSIGSVALSDDGRWAAYAYSRRETDDTLFVRQLDAAHTITVPRASRPQFSDDGRWLAYLVTPPHEEVEKLEDDDEPVPLKAELRDLETGDVVASWNDVDAIEFSMGAALLAVKKRKADPKADHDGADLILRNLRAGTEDLIGLVGQHAFNESGSHLAYTISTASREGNGLYLLAVATSARRAVDGAREDYARLTWDEDGRAVAVLRAPENDSLEERTNTLVAVTGIIAGEPRVHVYDAGVAAEAQRDTVLSERSPLTWSADLSRVFVGLKEQLPKLDEDDDEPRPDVDIWHYRDDRIQSVQQVRANADRDRTHTAAFDLESGRLVRLADATMSTLRLTRDGRWGIGEDERGYVHDWKPQLADYYRVDTRTGARTPVLTAHGRTLGLSPDSRNFLYWQDGHIWNYVLADDRHINLTERAPVSFVNEQYDRFGEKPPYGIAGWTEDGESVILEHRFDLYLQPLDGGVATNLTGGVGTRDSVQLRYVQLDEDEHFIDLDQPVLLSAFGERDKRSGFFRLERGRVSELAWGDVYHGRPQKAADADRVLVTIERFDVFPDYHVTDTRFANVTPLTNANPQQSEYRWGRRILFDFEVDGSIHGSAEPIPLQGTIALPEDYQPGEKLPMLVNYYEKNSQNLHRYPTPRYASSPQFAGFVSNRYIVMQPDIHFSTGPSHSQMLHAVEAAVRKVIELGYADPDRIGLHGHSYSGQGSAYIATQSELFAAIVAGAAATNLVSDFNQLWKSAGTNQHRYDTYGQGRFATNPFDDLELYQSQSAVYNAPTMDTPLLLLHGTADGSVEWLQAVEFYNALRFNEKPVILLSYPGEAHGLRRFENQKDFLVRMQQFFDHHLKGAPATDWMENGVPFLQKQRVPSLIAPPAATTTTTTTSTTGSTGGGG